MPISPKVIAVRFIVSTIIRRRQRFAALSADLPQSTRGGAAAMTGDRMNRRCVIAAGAAAVIAPLASLAQETQRVRRIGVLALDRPEGLGGATLPLLRESLRRLGYQEGRNLVIEERWAEGDLQRLDEFAQELVRLKLDVIVPITNYEIAALKRIRHAVPVVMYFGALPVELGFVETLARPGGNVTGTAYHSTETAGKIVGLLKEAMPSVARTALLWNPAFPGMRMYGFEVDRVAPTLGMSVEYFDATTAEEIPAALKRLAASRAQALFVAYDSIIGLRLEEIAGFAVERRMVSFGTSPVFALRGGCLAYGPDLADISYRTASHVDRILRGAKPAELPVEQPRKFQFVVNLKTARAIGYAPPPAMLARADLVIE
jgi:putative ABC transport system substrate-binding protein